MQPDLFDATASRPPRLGDRVRCRAPYEGTTGTVVALDALAGRLPGRITVADDRGRDPNGEPTRYLCPLPSEVEPL